jgi:hypothetical protein
MTLQELLSSGGLKLNKNQVAKVGIALGKAFFEEHNYKPKKVKAVENGLYMTINNYPDEWMQDRGATIIIETLKGQRKNS